MNDAPPYVMWSFAAYSVAYEGIVWGLFGWAVFIEGRSPWWALLALLLSGCQISASRWRSLFDGKPRDTFNFKATPNTEGESA